MEKLKKNFKGIGFVGWFLFAAAIICFIASIGGLWNQRQSSNIITEFSWVSRCWWESCTIRRPPRFLWKSFAWIELHTENDSLKDVEIGSGPEETILVVSNKNKVSRSPWPYKDWDDKNLPENYAEFPVAVEPGPESTIVVVKNDGEVSRSSWPYMEWENLFEPEWNSFKQDDSPYYLWDSYYHPDFDVEPDVITVEMGPEPDKAIVAVVKFQGKKDVYIFTSGIWSKLSLNEDISNVKSVAIGPQSSPILVVSNIGTFLSQSLDNGWKKLYLPDNFNDVSDLLFGSDSIIVVTGHGGRISRTHPPYEVWEDLSMPMAPLISNFMLVGRSPNGTIVTGIDSKDGYEIHARLPQTPPLWIGLLMIVGVFDLFLFSRRVKHVWQQIGEESESGEQNVPNIENDNPIDHPEQATNALRDVAKRIFQFVSNPDASAPLTFALTGKWGSGKSSLMRLVERYLSENSYPCVWFNAWHHQNESHLFAALMESIRRNAVPRSIREYIKFYSKLVKLRTPKNKFAVLLFIILILAAIAWLIREIIPNFDFWKEFKSGSITLVKFFKDFDPYQLPPLILIIWLIFSRWNPWKAFGVTPSSLVRVSAAWIQFPRFQDRLSFRHQFGLAFEDVCKAFGNRRLVIIIDDLDRCQSENIVEILEALNFLTSSGNCFVLLGIDENQVKRAVGLHYKDIAAETAREKQKGEVIPENNRDDVEENKKIVGDISEIESYEARQSYAEHYLEKLINLNIQVPVVDEQDLSTLRSKDQS